MLITQDGNIYRMSCGDLCPTPTCLDQEDVVPTVEVRLMVAHKAFPDNGARNMFNSHDPPRLYVAPDTSLNPPNNFVHDSSLWPFPHLPPLLVVDNYRSPWGASSTMRMTGRWGSWPRPAVMEKRRWAPRWDYVVIYQAPWPCFRWLCSPPATPNRVETDDDQCEEPPPPPPPPPGPGQIAV